MGTQGGQNLRDLGGYPTRDGRTIRHGMIFRSGTMHALTEQDHTMLRALDIRTVCDFRNADERAGAPVAWPPDATPRIFADDRGRDISLAPVADETIPTPEQARATMIRLYADLLMDFAAQYRTMFAELVAGHAPLIFNCTAGKDRTGIAAALLLAALNVPREAIVDDYLRTNHHFDAVRAMRAAQANSVWRDVPAAVLRAYQLADGAYLGAVFEVLDGHPGGEAAYLAQVLGVDAAARATLRATYTEPREHPQ